MHSEMPEGTVVEWIHGNYVALLGELDERGRRRWAATESVSSGRGGIAAVAEATGISDRTIRNGIRELTTGGRASGGSPAKAWRRSPGREKEQPDLIGTLERLVEPASRGDPMSPLRWSCKSTRTSGRGIETPRFSGQSHKGRRAFEEKGYSLQANRKTREGKQHPDRNAQFEHINRRVMACQRRGQPAVSVDTKKKEVLGNRKNAGRTYRPKGKPRRSIRTTSRMTNWARRSPTASMIWIATKPGFPWGSTTTPPSLRSLRSHSGGNGWGEALWPPPSVC